MKNFNILKRKILHASITNEETLLEYLGEKYVGINKSLVLYLNEKINENVSSVLFKKIMAEYMPSKSLFSKTFYLKRGYTVSESIEIIKNIQTKNQAKRDYKRESNPRCIEYYLSRNSTVREANEALTVHQSKDSKRTLLYWTARGFCQEDAKNKIRVYQDNSKHINYLHRNTSFGNLTEKWFKRNPEKKSQEGILYYFSFIDKIDEKKYWKIGISTNDFNKRFSKKIQKEFQIDLIFIKEDTIYNSLLEEQKILTENKEFRVKTSLTTESFSEDVLYKY